jgi:hypothetical protein
LRPVVRQVGELVQHQFGPGRRDRDAQHIRVEHVADHRVGPEPPQPLRLVRRAGHPGDVVASRHQQRHQADPDHAGRAGQEDAHDPDATLPVDNFFSAVRPLGY